MKFKFVFFLMSLIFLNSAPLRADTSKVLLDSVKKISDDPYFEQVVNKQNDDTGFERAKIEYLIERLRQSKMTFIRNREPHDGREAASHMEFKYHKADGRVKTARDFITYIASKSLLTNELYKIRLADGTTYPARDVLFNELRLLESLIQHRSQRF